MIGSNSKKNIALLLAVSVVLYTMLYFLFAFLKITGVPLYLMIPLLFFVSSASNIILLQARDKTPRLFVYSYLIISLSKLMLYGAFIFVYALSHREVAKPFALVFFLLYLIYTFIEIRALRKK